MLVLNMNSKRQRRPNVRLWEVGDLPAAFTCGVSKRIKQTRRKDDSLIRNNELEKNDDFGFLEFEVSADISENKKPNSLELVSQIPGEDEIDPNKAELCFGSITRKSRVMKRRRRSPDSLFLDPWGSKVNLVRNVGDFAVNSGFDESSEHETTWTDKAEPNFGVHSSNEHCDEMEIAQIKSVGEWLEEIGFGKYARLFEMHEVDEETLPLLTLDDLKEMGIFEVGIRRKLFNAIKTAKGRQCRVST